MERQSTQTQEQEKALDLIRDDLHEAVTALNGNGEQSSIDDGIAAAQILADYIKNMPSEVKVKAGDCLTLAELSDHAARKFGADSPQHEESCEAMKVATEKARDADTIVPGAAAVLLSPETKPGERHKDALTAISIHFSDEENRAAEEAAQRVVHEDHKDDLKDMTTCFSRVTGKRLFR